MNMTDEQMRIAIAEACGWRPYKPITHDGRPLLMIPPKMSNKEGWLEAIPDYLNDLNAMHEAEKVLTEKGVNAWWAYVAHINRNNPTPFRAESAVHATARQRAEAFIKTLNLEPK
jgi:hypothetical protein